MIADLNIVSHSNQHYGKSGYCTTTDKIFLLSIEEAGKYLGRDNSTRIATDGIGAVSWYWLRQHLTGNVIQSDSSEIITVAGIIKSHIGSDGRAISSRIKTYEKGGVRPAMWIKL